jgi:predicted  nucleic acid-binding Zn-ribbon protein
MNPQIELLVQIQELDLMIRELSNEKTTSAEKKLGFVIRGVETLRDTREQLAKKVEVILLRKYERVTARYPRAVVPMRDGVCFGCFMRQPAQKAVVGAPETAQVESCQHCGRILFRVRLGEGA